MDSRTSGTADPTPVPTAGWINRLAGHSGPLLTWYLPDRVEFSGPVWARWWAKIDNFLEETFPFGPDGALVSLPETWQKVAWELGLRARGWRVAISLEDAELVVSDDLQLLSEGGAAGVTTLAQPTDPLGLRWVGELPPGVVDGAGELMGQADALLDGSAPGDPLLTATSRLGGLQAWPYPKKAVAGPRRVLLRGASPELLTETLAQLWWAGHSVVIGADDGQAVQEGVTAQLTL